MECSMQKSPPKWESLTPSSQREFTMQGKIMILDKYLDNASEECQQEFTENFTLKNWDKYRGMAKRREVNYYGPTDTHLYNSFDQFPIKDKDVLIIGSTNPWYEAVAIEFGAKSVTVVEYSNRNNIFPGVEYIKPEEVPLDKKWDACISISSYEHDGLGRYGDPINPDGDLDAMHYLQGMLEPQALVYLALPLGADKVVWNAHRIYGLWRLPLMLKGWGILGASGFDIKKLLTETGDDATYQPVWVLINP